MVESGRDEKLLQGHLAHLNSDSVETTLMGVVGISRMARDRPELLQHLRDKLESGPHPLVAESIQRALNQHSGNTGAAAAPERHRSSRT